MARSRSAERGLIVAVFVTAMAAPASAKEITLDEALSLAAKQNPDLQIGAADVQVSEGELLGARTIPNNPELGFDLGPTFAGGETTHEWNVSLSQTIELGGKRSKRVAAARARVDGAGLRVLWTRLLVELRVRRAYSLAVVARSLLAAAGEGEAVAGELKAAAQERLRLGGGTQLEVNTATAVAGRAKSDRLTAEREYREARAELAAAIGAPGGADYEPAGDLPEYEVPAVSEDDFVTKAIASRPDLAAVRQDREAAEADLALAKALAVPDASIGAIYGHSGVDEADTVLVGLSITLPFWNRNQGGKASARAASTRAKIVEDSARREADREARTAYRNYLAARDAVLAFDRDVVDKLGENLELARESFRAGKIGLLEFNVVRRDLVETRFAYLDAVAALVEAEYALKLAAGGAMEQTK